MDIIMSKEYISWREEVFLHCSENINGFLTVGNWHKATAITRRMNIYTSCFLEDNILKHHDVYISFLTQRGIAWSVYNILIYIFICFWFCFFNYSF